MLIPSKVNDVWCSLSVSRVWCAAFFAGRVRESQCTPGRSWHISDRLDFPNADAIRRTLADLIVAQGSRGRGTFTIPSHCHCSFLFVFIIRMYFNAPDGVNAAQ